MPHGHRREVLRALSAVALVGMALYALGCGSSSPVDVPASATQHQRELAGLGGPAKAPLPPPKPGGSSDHAPVLHDGGAATGTLHHQAVDWYRFTAQDAPYQVVTATPLAAGGDVDLYVFPGSGASVQPLASRRCRTWVDWVALDRSRCAPGTVGRVAVYGYGSSPGAYPPDPGQYPYSLEYDAARPLAAGVSLDGRLSSPGRQAWFTFPVTGGAFYQVTVTPHAGDPDLYVYSGDSAGCLGWSATSGSEVVRFYAPEKGSILVRVRAASAPATFTVAWRKWDPGALPPPTAGSAERVLLIGWDGVRRGRVEDALAAGQLPHLKALLAHGSWVDTTIVDHGADTKSGWAEIVTGYPATVTGIYSLNTFQPIPEGLTIFERAKRYYRSQGRDFRTMAVMSKDENLGSGPGLPYFYTVRSLDAWAGDRHRWADESGPIMLEDLDRFARGPFFALFHFADPDSDGHQYGEASPQYTQALIRCDRWLGKLQDKLRALGVEQQTRLFIATDHCFHQGGFEHGGCVDAWLISDQRDLVRSGTQGDVCPTLYHALGMPYTNGAFQPPLPGRSLTGR